MMFAWLQLFHIDIPNFARSLATNVADHFPEDHHDYPLDAARTYTRVVAPFKEEQKVLEGNSVFGVLEKGNCFSKHSTSQRPELLSLRNWLLTLFSEGIFDDCTSPIVLLRLHQR